MKKFGNLQLDDLVIADAANGTQIGELWMSSFVLDESEFTDTDEFDRFNSMLNRLSVYDRWNYKSIPGGEYVQVRLGNLYEQDKLMTSVPGDVFTVEARNKAISQISGDNVEFAGDFTEFAGKYYTGTGGTKNGVLVYDPVEMTMRRTSLSTNWHIHTVKGESGGKSVLVSAPYNNSKTQTLKYSFDGTAWHDGLELVYGTYDGGVALGYCNGVFFISKSGYGCHYTTDVSASSWPNVLNSSNYRSLTRVSDSCLIGITSGKVDLIDVNSPTDIQVRNVCSTGAKHLYIENTRLVFEYGGKTYVFTGGCENVLFGVRLYKDTDGKMQFEDCWLYQGSDFINLDGSQNSSVPTTKSITKFGNRLFYNNYKCSMFSATIENPNTFTEIDSNFRRFFKGTVETENLPENWLSVKYSGQTEGGFKTIGENLYFMDGSSMKVTEKALDENGNETYDANDQLSTKTWSCNVGCMFRCDYDAESNFMRMEKLCNVPMQQISAYL